VISLLAFWLSSCSGDEVLDYLSIEQGDYHVSMSPHTAPLYSEVAYKRGLDLLTLFFLYGGLYQQNFSVFSLSKTGCRATVESKPNRKVRCGIYPIEICT
jgi:hypothetical protein